MGAGRKTSTYDVDTSIGPNIRSFEDRQRNLGSQLYGCIFGGAVFLVTTAPSGLAERGLIC